MMTSKEIRQTFLDFFASKGHTIVPSAPMVVKNDPTLMFTNAGMNQFKEWFLGNAAPKYPRAADTQKCLRVSGKHNDLEEVGHDTYHHTMFEMLGNWSFGDYFKKEAIGWAWELLTEVYKLDKSRLYATVFEGYAPDGLEMDSEAKGYWQQYLPDDHILRGNKHDNFWEMGDTGPCGPCSEIHIDLRDEAEIAAKPGAELVNEGHPLVIEIWNLVFMQYNRKANGSLENLPARHIDTGMGFERLCMALQGKKSNYDTDVFTGMIAAIAGLCGKEYNQSEQTAVAMRVIADHIRAISFSIADGQLPSNNKAGYVIRRILRRAVRYGYTFLDMKEPFLCLLVPTLVAEMGDAFPELKAQQTLITRVIKEEEEAFLRTLDKGIRLMDSIMEKSKATKVISGVDAFTLYDTFGFPIDLSELIARENGYTIDLGEFNVELEKQKNRARNATAVEAGDWVELLPGTESEFVGYDMLEADARIVKYRTVKAKGKEQIQIVLDRTPFYAEMGGEVGDTGELVSAEGEKLEVLNTIKENGLAIHLVDRLPGDPAADFTAKVDAERRTNIANNHTATHLLHFALRKILGTHVEQKGSYVGAASFRFDFSHYEKVSKETLDKVERMVNQLIRANAPLEEFRDISIDEARSRGAMALFGEKYGDKVRMIKFGDSTELCGGCHASATGNIGYFRILSESAVAAGIRRIEATTGINAELSVDVMEDILERVKAMFGNAGDPAAAVGRIIEENEQYKKAMEAIAKEKMADIKASVVANAKQVNGIKLMTLTECPSMDFAKGIAHDLHGECNSAAFVAAFESGDKKPCLVVMYTDDLVAAGRDASADIRQAAQFIQGGGGGQKFLATAGGKNVAGLSEALNKLTELAAR
ncbi:MAG: alanine--tRNA ligase [Bacteroidales bacterium]|nr:alanine--tRNA ligase [Bacteroidales bacterium]